MALCIVYGNLIDFKYLLGFKQKINKICFAF